jgi:FlaG/FlaF family flagellin (archaellin)
MKAPSLVSPRALLRLTLRGRPRPAGLGSALVPAAVLLAVGLLVAVTWPAAAASLATGDPRSVSQPSIPATCATVSASLATSNRQFSYSSGNGSHIPDYTNIVVDGAKAVSSASGAKSVLEGYSSSDPLGLTLENVSFDATATTAESASIGTYDTNLKPSGTDVTVSAISGSGSVPSCSFPTFPGL